MIILGLDPGTTTTGFGVVAASSKHEYKTLDYGEIHTKPKIPQQIKLAEIYRDLNILVKKYKPDLFSIEKVFFNTNPKTVITVSQARGVCMLIAGQQNIEVVEFTPIQVKNNVVGYGRAEKKQVQYMVQKMLKLSEIPKPDDAADALALAISAALTNYKI